jgi:hypothetical protein
VRERERPRRTSLVLAGNPKEWSVHPKGIQSHRGIGLVWALETRPKVG